MVKSEKSRLTTKNKKAKTERKNVVDCE